MAIFDQDTFPYHTLAEFGLTREMIEDLPEYVLDTISKGGRSPLLPMVIPAKFGNVSCFAKFRLTNNLMKDGTAELVFYPKLSEAPLDSFNEEEKSALLEGKAIRTKIDLPDISDPSKTHKTRCYVQIDPDTKHVFYTPSSVIARNIQGMDSSLSLPLDDFKALTKGELVTIRIPEFLTIGINLFTDTGVFACHGDAETWKSVVGKSMPAYSFGIEGCWVNHDGKLQYVKEEDFDEDIEQARKLSSRGMHSVESDSLHMTDMNLHNPQHHTENSQVTR